MQRYCNRELARAAHIQMYIEHLYLQYILSNMLGTCFASSKHYFTMLAVAQGPVLACCEVCST
jgi:hypothetical protein